MLLKTLKIWLLCVFFIAFGTQQTQHAQAETVRRALLVGINTYNPPEAKGQSERKITDLDGAVNDIEAVRQLLISKYQFDNQHIKILLNEQASRAGILAALEQLVKETQAGDVVFFHYSGHGSQVYNPASDETDKKDETIVPADALQGAEDIRDKEIQSYLNSILDKNAQLTAVFDSCHSGSISRGAPILAKARHASPSQQPVKLQATAPRQPAPETRGALIISAAQDRELAYETKEWVARGGTGNGQDLKPEEVAHGALTSALLKVLTTMPPGTPVMQVFQQVQSALRHQTPVMAGTAERKNAPLLGGNVTEQHDLMIAVRKVESDGTLTLDAGYAIGLQPQTILLAPDGQTEVEVTAVLNLSSSEGQVKTGSAKALKPGTLLKVKQWSFANLTPLNILLTDTLQSAQELAHLQQLQTQLTQQGYQLSTDPTETSPDYLLLKLQGKWHLIGHQTPPQLLGAELQLATLKQQLTKGSKLFISLPAETLVTETFKQHFGDTESRVQLTQNLADSDYYLLGRTGSAGPEYALIRPGVSHHDADKDAFPARTDWQSATKPEVDKLKAHAFRLSRIKTWLSTEVLDSVENGYFPYQLGLKDLQTGKILDTRTEAMIGGKEYQLVLQLNPEQVARIGHQNIEQRYVYIFALDKNGNSVLLVPGGDMTGNFLPIMPHGESRFPDEIALSRFKVGEPYGMDTFILMTTPERLAQAHVHALESQGVRTRSKRSRGAQTKAYENLILDISEGTRGTQASAPTQKNWSFKRAIVQSKKP